MYNTLIIFGIALLLASFRDSIKESSAIDPQVTIMMIQPKVHRQVRTNFGNPGIGAPGEELWVVDSNYVYRALTIKYAPDNDTVRINFNRDKVQVNFRYKAFDELNFLFKEGDSVIISYNGDSIFAEVTNRETSLWDINFDLYAREHIYKNEYPSSCKALYGIFIGINELPQSPATSRSRFLISSRKEIEKENSALDSLLKLKQLSQEYFDFYKSRNMFRLEKINLLESDQYVRPDWTKDSISILNQYYVDFVFRLYTEEIENKLDKMVTSTGSHVDYRVAFNEVEASNYFTAKDKDFLLYYLIEQIISYGSKDVIEQYFKKFSSVVTNKKLINAIRTRHNLDFNSSAELQLKTPAGENIIFKQVLKRHKGKVVYIDFWASWCGPCIASIPDAGKLREDYKGKDVSFVFLSKDEDYNRWLKSAQKHKLINNESFLINNQHTSNMLDELKIKEIPRYLLFDKQGNLVHKNAPGPKGNEIRKLIDTYLKQE